LAASHAALDTRTAFHPNVARSDFEARQLQRLCHRYGSSIGEEPNLEITGTSYELAYYDEAGDVMIWRKKSGVRLIGVMRATGIVPLPIHDSFIVPTSRQQHLMEAMENALPCHTTRVKIPNLIGRVAAGWSNLEHELDRIIWLLLPAMSPEAGCVTSQLMGATPRYRTIIAQLTLKHRQTSDRSFEKFISRTNSLMQETYEPQEKRNRIIHDAWYFDTLRDRAAQFRSWPAKDLRFGINPVDLTDIETTLTKIDALRQKVEKLYIDIEAVIPPSTEKRL